MNFTNLLASIKVKDIMEEPPSPEDSEIITELRSNPPPNTASLFDLISKIQVPAVPKASSSRRDPPLRQNFSKPTSKIILEVSASHIEIEGTTQVRDSMHFDFSINKRNVFTYSFDFMGAKFNLPTGKDFIVKKI